MKNQITNEFLTNIAFNTIAVVDLNNFFYCRGYDVHKSSNRTHTHVCTLKKLPVSAQYISDSLYVFCEQSTYVITDYDVKEHQGYYSGEFTIQDGLIKYKDKTYQDPFYNIVQLARSGNDFVVLTLSQLLFTQNFLQSDSYDVSGLKCCIYNGCFFYLQNSNLFFLQFTEENHPTGMFQLISGQLFNQVEYQNIRCSGDSLLLQIDKNQFEILTNSSLQTLNTEQTAVFEKNETSLKGVVQRMYFNPNGLAELLEITQQIQFQLKNIKLVEGEKQEKQKFLDINKIQAETKRLDEENEEIKKQIRKELEEMLEPKIGGKEGVKEIQSVLDEINKITDQNSLEGHRLFKVEQKIEQIEEKRNTVWIGEVEQ
ncbi:Hypothetical_protein [Hexamita inflata]|uniref:Hypothetical_protein n=1 Tax=Hexamita inflata TaxID=28002 RepID=A0AA86QRY0_9EUKA|nr:Hypothetical protein HINF_LOCUS19863 [Hexamita inflata]CAI9961972.1 Hypothetical protein HINF_LOCUS49617 [Hexamita inflata]